MKWKCECGDGRVNFTFHGTGKIFQFCFSFLLFCCDIRRWKRLPQPICNKGKTLIRLMTNIMIVMSVFHNRFEEVMKRLRNWRRNLECPLWKIFLMTTFCTKYLILTKGMSNI